jgi:cellulose synthase/poly-beta-1,6-N-acetylglucosamine synthase-like glycosyltransferase
MQGTRQRAGEGGAIPARDAARPGAAPAGADRLRLVPASEGVVQPRRRGLIGERLVAAGALDPGDLDRALALQTREESRLGDILLTHKMVSESDLRIALAEQWRSESADLVREPPDPALVAALTPQRCLRLGTVPWQRVGGATLVATAWPERFGVHRAELEAALGPVIMTLASEREVAAAVAAASRAALSRAAERDLPAALSCRGWQGERMARALVGLVLASLAGAVLAPVTTIYLFTCVVMASLVAMTLLKGLALVRVLAGGARLHDDAAGSRGAEGASVGAALAHVAPTALRLPVVSVMIPLLREEDIAGRLIARLEKLDYPRELVDILLLVEAHDHTTRGALERTRLPGHIRALIVPPGTVQTKPRALNYGLSFARGQIVGIWDAEDAPHPAQLRKVAQGFAARGPEVACLQGALDFYNARTNWMSRCFALEYRMWFRAMLPGLQALGLPIPLGGTTLFLRRAALERVAGWDAHNVTEDADLGIRLARAGYRTEMVDTVTGEEANCALLPWIRQRSRWIKGYAMTWAVHMRAPRRLWRDLGPRGFAGFQVLFLGTLLQFLLAPLMLSFWLLALGLPHPLAGHVPAALGWSFLAVALASEAVTVGLVLAGNRARAHRMLWPWIPLLHLYFPLATLAAYKALWEMITRPFFWDKTMHGAHGEDETGDDDPDVGPGAAAPESDAPTGSLGRA